MEKYHISPKTGNPNRCYAQRRCPLGASDEEHYGSKVEAREAYEKQQQAPQTSLRKPKRIVTATGEAGEHNLYAGIPKGSLPKPGKHCDLIYLSDRDADEALDWWQRPSRTTDAVYSQEERRAIIKYQGKDFEPLGRAVRGEEELEASMADQVGHLKAAVKKARLLEPVTLFRGVKGDHASSLASLTPGEVVSEKSFASTSPSEKTALGFARAQGVLLQIETPANTPAIDLGADVFSIDEDEILLGSHTATVIAVQPETLDGVEITRVILRYDRTT